jgi:hypothetical protein
VDRHPSRTLVASVQHPGAGIGYLPLPVIASRRRSPTEPVGHSTHAPQHPNFLATAQTAMKPFPRPVTDGTNVIKPATTVPQTAVATDVYLIKVAPGGFPNRRQAERLLCIKSACDRLLHSEELFTRVTDSTPAWQGQTLSASGSDCEC